MFYKPTTTLPQADPLTLRHRCRNPKCRGKLKTPVENERDAFCTRGCYTSFYRHRCLVCEGPIARAVENQKICKKAKCRNAFRAVGLWPVFRVDHTAVRCRAGHQKR
jgi:hypothetical protein